MGRQLKIGNAGCFLLDGVPYDRRQVMTVWDLTNETLSLHYMGENKKPIANTTLYSDYLDGDNGDAAFASLDALITWAEANIYFGATTATVTLANGATVALVDNTEVINRPRASIPYYYEAASSTNATVVYAAACQLHSVVLACAHASGRRTLKIYDKATAPNSGDTPKYSLPMAAGAPVLVICFASPANMDSGLAFATTLQPGTSDFTAVTAGDLYFTLNYAI